MGDYDELRWYDWLIFAVTVAVTLAISVFFALSGGRQKTTAEYMMGDRKFGLLPVTLSLLMSGISGVLILGNTAESYEYGMITWIRCLADLLGQILSALILVPMLYRLKLTSVCEYLELRYRSKAVRIVGAVMMIIIQLFYMGICLFAPAVALYVSAGIPPVTSILVTGLLVTFYTTIGGLKAVVWTDVFQGLVLLSGVFLLLILGSIKAGGIVQVFRIAGDTGRLTFIETEVNPLKRATTWNLLLNDLTYCFLVMIQQGAFQRFAAVKDLKTSQISIFIHGVMFVVAFSLTLLGGLVVFAYYYQMGCDPLKTDRLRSPNELFLYFVMTGLQIPCIPGLMLAVIFSGAASSASSSINAISSLAWTDLLDQRYHHLKEGAKVNIAKMLALITGVVGTLMAFLFLLFPNNLSQVAASMFGAMSGPLGCLFFIGACFPCAEWIGALVGSLLSFGTMFSITLINNLHNTYHATLESTVENCSLYNMTVKNETAQESSDAIPWLFRLSYTLYPVIGIALSTVLSLATSLIVGRCKNRQVDPRYMIRLCDLCCCLPKRMRKHLWCEVPNDGGDANLALNERYMENERLDCGITREKLAMEVLPEDDQVDDEMNDDHDD